MFFTVAAATIVAMMSACAVTHHAATPLPVAASASSTAVPPGAPSSPAAAPTATTKPAAKATPNPLVGPSPLHGTVLEVQYGDRRDSFYTLNASGTAFDTARAVTGLRVASWTRAVAPTADKMAWLNDDGTLMLAGIDGRGARAIATITDKQRELCNLMTWSPDGTRLVVGPTMVNVRTGKVTTLNLSGVGDGGVCAPAMSADGSTIAYNRTVVTSTNPFTIKPGDHELLVMRTDGTGRHTVVVHTPTNLRLNTVAALSRDGRRAIVEAHVPNAGECGCTMKLSHWIVDLSSGQATRLGTIGGFEWGAAFASNGDVNIVVNLNQAAENDVAEFHMYRFTAAGVFIREVKLPATVNKSSGPELMTAAG
jgi:hypothetical protein